jgi:hypothetical protein
MGIHIASQQYFNSRLFSRQALTTIDFALLIDKQCNPVELSVVCAPAQSWGHLDNILDNGSGGSMGFMADSPPIWYGGFRFLSVVSEAAQWQRCWIFVHQLCPCLSGVCPTNGVCPNAIAKSM